jgi:membrane associated rhomboid family serine protease
MLNVPLVVLACVAALLLVHGVREFLSPSDDVGLLLDLSFIPAQWSLYFDPARAQEMTNAAGAETGSFEAAMTAILVSMQEQGGPGFWTWGSYGLLHGSWPHVILNCVWLLAFGTPVARRCKAGRFLALAIVATVAGSVAHYSTNSGSLAPLVGASAAVSGMMAAAVRFMYAPVRYDAWTGRELEPHERPRQSLRIFLADKRVLMFLGVWFGVNLVTGLASGSLGVTSAAIAWEAHVGGFLAGLALFPLLDPVPRGA